MSPTSPTASPPPPPSPSQDIGLIPQLNARRSPSTVPSPPPVSSPTSAASWDAHSIAPETAMKMLSRSLSTLAQATGEVPPTPPLSVIRSRSGEDGYISMADAEAGKSHLGAEGEKSERPETEKGEAEKTDKGKTTTHLDVPSASAATTPGTPNRRHHRRTPSGPGTPMPSDDIRAPTFERPEMGAPEASSSEPATGDVGEGAEPLYLQQIAIARKFFSKKPPPFSLDEYLSRLQRYCPMSTAVYMAAGTYIYRLVVERKLVPATARTVHRLVLASLRVAMKALEDLRYSQERFAGVGGVRGQELGLLEISLCYLTGFELQLSGDALVRGMVGLAQAASVAERGIPGGETFRIKLPVRKGKG